MNDPNVDVVLIFAFLIAILAFLCICIRMEIKSLMKIADKYKNYYEKTQIEIQQAKTELSNVAERAATMLIELDNKKEEIENAISKEEKHIRSNPYLWPAKGEAIEFYKFDDQTRIVRKGDKQ